MGTDISIVGAGIGGLAAGIALRKAGFGVRVLERAAAPRELGFALLLAPNAMLALRELGVADAVIEGGVVGTSGEIRRPDGTVLKRLDVARVQKQLVEPTVCALRSTLHGALLEALGSDALEPQRNVLGVTVEKDGATVHLEGGNEYQAPVLVGADGVRSAVRAALHPGEPPPRRSGLWAFRGVAKGAAAALGDITGGQYLGAGCEAGFGRASRDTVYWYLSVPAPSEALEPPAVLAREITRFHAPFREIVESTAPADLRHDDLVDRDPIERWGQGRVTLLGDAAHPMLPHAGQGAAQALEDAVTLARALEACSSVEDGLRKYERARAPRTAAILRLARRNARIGSVRNRLLRAVRDQLIRAVPESLFLKTLVDMGRPGWDLE